jgi:hypothetical protein
VHHSASWYRLAPRLRFDVRGSTLHGHGVHTRPHALVPAVLIAALQMVSCNRTVSGSSGAGEADRVRASSTAVMSAAQEDQGPPPTHRAPKSKPGASQKVKIAAGTFTAGSTPGDVGRDPGLEPSLEQIDLGEYSVDRLPYPNDPAQPPRTGVTREQAQSLCAERGERLCTEAEWERACKGPDDDKYPTGTRWDPACEQRPNDCATGFDVLAMGLVLREWTSSVVEGSAEGERTLGVLRGARAGSAAIDHRCARREPADPGAQSGDIGFRCCSGPPNAAVLKRPVALPAFRKVQLDPAQVTAMIETVPQLASLGEVSFFKDPDDVNVVTGRGDGGKSGAIMTTSPLMWSPDLGEELLVFAAKGSSGSSFIAAFYKLPGDRYRIASSFVLKQNAGPIVLAFNGWVRRRITWSTCWGCLGEEGAVIYRKNRRVVIEQL